MSGAWPVRFLMIASLAAAIGIVSQGLSGSEATAGDVQHPMGPDVPDPGNAPLPPGSERVMLAVQNAGVGPADASVAYYFPDGIGPSSGDDLGTLARGGSALTPTGGYPADAGYATAYSPSPLAELMFRDIKAAGSTDSHSYSGVTVPAHGAPKLAMPILLAELGPLRWNSRIVVQNIGTDLACLEVRYFVSRSMGSTPVGKEIVDKPLGEPGCPAGHTLAPGAQLKLGGGTWADHTYPDQMLNTQSGATVRVLNANGNNDIVATVDLYRSDGNRLLGSYNAFASGTGASDEDDVGTEVVMPLAIKWISGWYTVIGAQNLGTAPADVNIRYIGSADSVPVDVTVTLKNVANVGFHSTYDESTPLPINFVGYAVVTSKQPVAALLVRAKQTWYLSGENEPIYTAVNGVPRAQGDTAWYAPQLYRRYDPVGPSAIGWNSWIQVQVADGGSANVTLTLAGTPGTGCPPGPFEFTTAVSGSKVFYMNADSDNGFPQSQVPACFAGAATVTGTKPLIVIAQVTSDNFPGGDNEALYNAVPGSRLDPSGPPVPPLPAVDPAQCAAEVEFLLEYVVRMDQFADDMYELSDAIDAFLANPSPATALQMISAVEAAGSSAAYAKDLDPPAAEGWAEWDAAMDGAMDLLIQGIDYLGIGITELDLDALDTAVALFDEAVISVEEAPAPPEPCQP